MQWKSNLFEVPRVRLAHCLYRSCPVLLMLTVMHLQRKVAIALKAAMVLPAVVLQKPPSKSKSKECSLRLEERLTRWAEGDENLCCTKDRQFRAEFCGKEWRIYSNLARPAEKLVSRGNVRAATRLISEEADKGSLPLNKIQPDGRSVRDHLIDNHPTGTSLDPSTISYRSPANEHHHIDFDQIDGPFVLSTIHGMSGSAGPSGLDARGWKRLCSSFKRASSDLCESIARLTKRLCTTYPSGVAPLIA